MTYQANRQILVELMQELGTFSLPQLYEEMQNHVGTGQNIAIDAHQTIQEFADQMAEQGTLIFLLGKYTWRA